MTNWTEVIGKAVQLVSGYNNQGIRPTLRQIHYRLASEQVGGYVNTQACYKVLSQKLVSARMNGILSWDAIADHVRYRWWFKLRPFEEFNPYVILENEIEKYGQDPWGITNKQVLIWLEKDALAELVLDSVGDLYVPLCISRGYSSWTFIYENKDLLNPNTTVLYLGDHDPSGLDIERFTQEAMEHFGLDFSFKRLALTYGQVQEYGLLPNPTKKADPRAGEYIGRYGDECWELDALEPRILQAIVRGAVEAEIDKSLLAEVERKNQERRQEILEKLKRRLGRSGTANRS
jgi:UDP-glucose 6-dehydrogenase